MQGLLLTPLNISGHLSMTGILSEMRITWVSGSLSVPMVRYGISKDSLTFNASGTWTTYKKDDLCWKSKGGERAAEFFWDPGMIHSAVMTHLTPRTKYFYQFGSEQEWSDIFSFRSPPVDHNSQIAFIAFGDSGVSLCDGAADIRLTSEPKSGLTTKRIFDAINVEPFDLLLHIGDISYAVGYSIRWDQFFQQIQPIATQLPYHVCIGTTAVVPLTLGNHEYDYIGQPFAPSWGNFGSDSRGECGVPFTHRFLMPKSPGSEGALWWSQEVGPAHFTFMSSEHNWTVGSPQYQWLEQDLASVNRSKTPWVILSGHRPMYTGMSPVTWDPNAAKVRKIMRDHLESLLMKYSVDVALWGHVHNYERTCPVYQEKCRGDLTNPGAPVHFVIGMGGADLTTEWLDPPPVWSKFRAAEHGYTQVYVSPTQLNLQYWTTQDGQVHDNVFLHKKHGFNFKAFE